MLHLAMIIDGQQVNYKDWRNATNILASVAHGTDNYFVQAQQDLEPIPEGTPVEGYRFVYHPPGQDVLVSPFSHAKVHLLEELGADIAADNHAHKIGQVQHDATERGFYYYRDRDLLEDYMRAYTGRVSDFEHTKVAPRVQITVSEGSADASVGPKPLSDTELFRKNLHRDDPSIPVLPKGKSVLATSFVADPEFGAKVKARGYVKYPALKFDPSEGWVNSYNVYKVANNAVTPNTAAFGTLELYRVTGIAKKNEYGDAGDIMQDMMYDPEPLLTIDVQEIYKAMHEND